MPTKISWTDEVWNPVTGCSHAGGPGCDHCFARRMSKRLAGRFGYPEAPHQFDVTLHPDRLEKPLHWKKPRRVFVNSMSDLFHKDVPFHFIDKVFVIMQEARQHTFQILTKRIDRAIEYYKRLRGEERFINLEHAMREMDRIPPIVTIFPFPNVWLGVSIENQKTADERISLLVQTPAALRFVSYEPALEYVYMGWLGTVPFSVPYQMIYEKIHWVIMGAETGPGARPMDTEWAREIRDECKEFDIPFFMKQVSGRAPIPPDLQIQQFPEERVPC